MRSVIFAAFILGGFSLGWAAPISTEERGAQSELDGMRASVTAVRVRGTKLAFDYKLERLPTDRSWYLKQGEPLTVQYWDRNNKPLNSAHTFFTVGRDFAYLKTSVVRDAIEVSLPKDAVRFTVALGNSGLETKAIKVPKPVQ